MSRQIILVLSTFLALLFSSFSLFGAQDDSNGIVNTQQRRASERFNIIDFIRNQQATIRGQNSKYGYGGSKPGPKPDLVLKYNQDVGPTVRTSTTLGKDTRATGRVQFLLDDLISKGDKNKLINIDIGGEGYISQTTNFAVDPSTTLTNHSYQESGGALLMRPFGRSSQDTGLLVKGGYMNFTETGLWANNSNQVSLYAPYLGAEAKLYLLNFLGIFSEYQAALETDAGSLQGKWKMQRFTYGAFLEILLVQFSAYLVNTQLTLTPTSTNNAVNENFNGVGFGGALFF